MSIKGDFGFEPENRVALTGRVKFVSKMIPTRSGVPFVGFTVDVPRLNGVIDAISCTAFEENATEICEHVAEGDVIHVEGSLRVYKGETVGCSVRVSEWWLEDGDVPNDPERREEALRRAEAELERQRMSIGTLLPPVDINGRESAAWTIAMMYGAAWEDKWRELGNGEAASDESIARVYGVLKDVKFPPRADFSGDPDEE